MTHYDVAIIGAGPGGYVAAIKAAQLGLSCALIEEGDVGGTCLNSGCIPTKTMLHTTELIDELAHAADFGVQVEGVSIDYAALRARTSTVREQLRSGIESLLAGNGVEVIVGRAHLGAKNRITLTPTATQASLPVSHNDAKTTPDPRDNPTSSQTVFSDEKIEVTATDVIIATGSRPATPPILGIDLPGVYTSDSLLEKFPPLESIAIIGGGVIGMEFAGIYTALGTEVIVLEAAGRILPLMDKELSQSLAMVMKKRGCSLCAGAMVERIEIDAADASKLTVHYTAKDQAHSVTVAGVLVATGRTPNTDNLFADDATPTLERGHIVVDKKLRTSAEHVYAIGDATNCPTQLAHAASAQGVVAASAIAGAVCDINLDLIPSCVYTNPEIACVGLDEAGAKQAGIAVQCGKFTLTGNGKTIIGGIDRSFIKVVADETGTLIGAQLMCGHATDMVGEFTLAIAQRLTVQQASDIVRAHPTFEEAAGEALEALLGGSIHAMPKKKRVQ
ncbi:MAG: dihydrolipoyl dehydrogenase [Raoultibacter sp.]